MEMSNNKVVQERKIYGKPMLNFTAGTGYKFTSCHSDDTV